MARSNGQETREGELQEPGKARPLFRASYETNAIMKVLKEMKQGDVITYDKLEKETGVSLETDSKGRARISSARRLLLDKHSMVFESVWGIGIKRLEDSETIKSANRGVTRIARAASREISKLQTIDFDGLDAKDKQHMITNQSILHVVGMVGAPDAFIRIEDAVQNRTRPLPIADTMKLFQRV